MILRVVKLSDTKTSMNVRLYLINNSIVSIVDTRLGQPTEILLKGMQQEYNFNSITNGWARLATIYGWAQPRLLGLPKQHLITLRLL